MKYEVLLTRDATESCCVEVDAESPEDAEEKAMAMAGRYGEKLYNWELDEGNCHDVYVSDDPESTQEID